jgi:hypothetical protein
MSSAQRVREAVDAAAAVDRSGWSGAARSAEVAELLAAQERLQALVTAAVGEWDRDATWALDGSVSPVAWLAHRCPLTRQDAAALVRSARHVARHEATAKALDAGDVTATHVQITARAVKHREDLYAEHETVLLDAARTLAPAAFRSAMAHWRRCADAVDDQQRATREITGNYFDVVPTFEGVGHLDGRLDAVSTAALIRVLDRMEPPDGFDGTTPPRTLAHRRADALVRLAAGDRPPAVSIDVTVDVDTLAGRPTIDLEAGCCEIAGVGPVSPAIVRILACDAAIGRVLMRGPSEVLDVGRRTRLVTASLRRALEHRDRGCVEPGCTAPAAWCDSHHIVHWSAHGPTDLANLELRCRRHHILQHQRDLHLRERRRE